MDDNIEHTDSMEVATQPSTTRRRLAGLSRRGATALLAGGLVIGGLGGGYAVSRAATATPSASASTTLPPLPGAPDRAAAGQQLLSAAAAAIGITPDQLRTEVGTGGTLAKVAQAHGVDPQKVIDAVVAAQAKAVDAAVAAGHLTADEAAQAKSGFASRAKDILNSNRPATAGGPGMPGDGLRGPGGPASMAEGFQQMQSAVASAIGISVDQLRTEIGTTGSIAKVAQAHGVSTQRVVDALVAAQSKALDAAVADGRMTADQAAKAKARFAGEANTIVNSAVGSLPGGPPVGPLLPESDSSGA